MREATMTFYIEFCERLFCFCFECVPLNMNVTEISQSFISSLYISNDYYSVSLRTILVSVIDINI